MKLAFVIFKFFPHGGLQLDFRRIAIECLKRGHKITVYTREWNGPALAGVELEIIDAKGFSNHAKAVSFERLVLSELANNPPDLTVGFNRMGGLDVYFAADNCFATESAATAGFKRFFTNRYRIYRAMEEKVFTPDAKTAIMYLTERQKKDFIDTYGTPDERFHLLPPGIEEDRKPPEDPAKIISIRNAVRSEFQIRPDEFLLIQVCSGFATKGVDRTLQTIAAIPSEIPVRLLIAGRDSSNRFNKLAEALKLSKRVIFAGGRDDIGDLLLAADLMIHPARKEATGTVLIEGLTAGLPMICSSVCGYEDIVVSAGGVVLAEPFHQDTWNKAVIELLQNPEGLKTMREKIVNYAASVNFYERSKVAAEIIEHHARKVCNEQSYSSE